MSSDGLHLHRRALYRRIARIEALLGIDLSDPRRLTALRVAQRALSFTAGGEPSPARARRGASGAP